MSKEDCCVSDAEKNRSSSSDCTPGNCSKDDDIYKLECIDCKRLVHYKCTNLPVYQLQLFLTTKYRRFRCTNCIEVPKYLVELMQVSDNSFNFRNLRKLRDLNDDMKSDIQKYKETIKSYEDTKMSQEKKIKKLEADVAFLRSSIKLHQENEHKLNDLIAKQQNELDEQQERFSEVGNPDFDVLVKLEEVLTTKLESIGKTLKESIMEEVNQNNKRSERIMNDIVTEGKTYADSVNQNFQVEKNAQIETVKVKDVENFQYIMRNAKNEELAEEREKQRRSCNIIIHGVNESENNVEQKKKDEEYVENFIITLGKPLEFKSVVRLGNNEKSTKRPIMVILKNEADKQAIMTNLNKLKNIKEFEGVSITEDYTMAERKLIREFSDQAKTKNAQEDDSRYEWKVRGTPKNGMVVIRLPKKRLMGTKPRVM